VLFRSTMGTDMGKLSRNKGKVGEREVAALMREFGFDARRGQQFKGTKDSPDVIHDMEGFYIEVKRREQLNLYDALDKADTEKIKGDQSIVFHRKNGKRWLVTIDAREFLSLVKELYEDV